MTEIYLFSNGEQSGPHNPDDVQSYVDQDQIAADTQVWDEPNQTWVPIASLFVKSAPKSAAPPPSIVKAEATPMKSRRSQPVDAGAKVEDALDSFQKRLSIDEQDPAAVARIIKRVSGILTKNETVEYIGVQKKPVVTISPDAIVLTNKRYIIARPKLTGFTFQDFLWRDVDDVHISEQMLGATISCMMTDGTKVSLDSIPKAQARKIYAFAQDVEEQMIEMRRTRAMEEKRAGAGGVIIQGGAMGGAPAVGGDPIEQLGKLKEMLEAGLIQAHEFESKKSEILSRM